MILKRYSTFVEDDGDEDEIWTSEDTVIQHAGAVEDGWDGILIEEETEDETEDEFEDCKQPLSADSRAAFPGQFGPY